MAKQPHVIIFNPDSYRGDVQGHLGNPAAVTPRLDEFVDTGGAVSYRNAFAQNPVCTPSRCSFMTGHYPHVHGHRSMRNLIKPHEKNLMSVLRDNGYFVFWGGHNDFVAIDEETPYSHYCDVKYERQVMMDGVVYPDKTEDWMRGAFYTGVLDTSACTGPVVDVDGSWVNGAVDLIRNGSLDKPLFVFLSLLNPHPEYLVEDIYVKDIDSDKLPKRIVPPNDLSQLPEIVETLHGRLGCDELTEDQWREVKRVYYGMCTKVDAYFGRIVDALKERGIYDDTLLIFMSDHGDFAGDYSLPEKSHASFQDSIVNVPFVMKPPTNEECTPGIRNQLIELIDMPASIYDYTGISPGYAVQGKSLRASLAGDEGPIRDAVFAEAGDRKDEAGYINDQVLTMKPDSFYALQSKGSITSHQRGSYGVMCRTLTHKYVRRGYSERHELYDLTNDPGETINLYDDNSPSAIQRKLERRLLDYFMTTGDVLPFKPDRRE